MVVVKLVVTTLWLYDLYIHHMYQFIQLHSCDYLKKISIKINLVTEKSKAEMKSDTEQTMKLE